MKLKRIILIGSVVLGSVLIISTALFAMDENSAKYFFTKEPFIHPKIIEDISTWVSDDGEQVVAINLLESMDTNRYFGDIKINGGNAPFVFYENTDQCEETNCPMGAPSFGYRLIGITSSDAYILFTESRGGGSGHFRNLLLVSLEKDKGLSYDKKNNVLRLDRRRLIIKKLAEIPLGDRYEGSITVKGNILHIGKDEYSKSSGFFKKDADIKVDIVR